MNPPPTKFLKEYRDLEKFDDGSCIKYMRISMPMMSDRDNVLQVTTKKMDDGTLLTMRTVEHPAMPEVKKVIRMYNHLVLMVKPKGNNTIMYDFEYANMKGYLPASLMNMALASETAKEFKNMMNILYAKQKK